ncbi:MAG: DUF2681 domain-containing protein [Gammaproteobacteria bacterium]|nr:DUF2681 domain-containing protein [Gammaproteobacteria bacterium]
MDIILTLVLAILVLIALLSFTVKRLNKATTKNQQLTKQNKEQQRIINNAKETKKIQHNNATLDDSQLNDSLHNGGYFRD